MALQLVNIHTHDSNAGPYDLYNVMMCKPDQPLPAPGTKYSLGIHPWDAGWLEPGVIRVLLREIEANGAMAAVGETGLDYSRDIDRKLQEELFRSHLEIARRKGLPVIIHCVHAFEPTMKILSGYDLPAVIFHSLIGSAEQVLAALKAGYYISIGEHCLNSSRMRDALPLIPYERLFLETDAGSTTIRIMYEKMAAILNTSVEELAASTMDNFKRLFP